MGKVGRAADTGEEVARGMSEAGKKTGAGASSASSAASSAATSMAEAGTKATRDASQAAQGLAETGMGAARSMGQAATGAMGAMGGALGSAMGGNMSDFSKLFDGMRMAAMPDMDLMLGAYRRNLEALSAANRVALEGAQQVARRNMEIMQQTMGEMTEAMRGLTSAESAQDRASKQAELLKGAYERAVAHMKELADLIQKSNGEALEVLNQRFAEAVDEARSMVEKARPA
jgi:phasin family protein